MPARQPARTKFTYVENRAFRRGHRVEFRESNQWYQGVIVQGPQKDQFDCQYVLVRSTDVDTRSTANGELIECRPNGVRPATRTD